MKSFVYHNPVQLHFCASLEDALSCIKESNLLILSSRSAKKEGYLNTLETFLGKKVGQIVSDIAPHPTVQHLQGLRKHGASFDAVVALGGGSVIDSAKFLSLPDIQLQQGKWRTDFALAKPIYALPTTSGSSSELTPWASIWDFENQKKYSLHHPNLFPKMALYIPKLTCSVPFAISLNCALDSLGHALESLWNKNANPISSCYAQKAIELFLKSIPQLFDSNLLKHIELRAHLMQASIFAGLAFSNTQTALAHALSYPLTLQFNVPHGLAVAFSLPVLCDSLPQGKTKDLLTPFLSDLNALFHRLALQKQFSFLNQKNIQNLFNELNERAQNSIFDLKEVQANLLHYYGHFR